MRKIHLLLKEVIIINIVQLLKEKDISIDISYYGINDIATGIQIKILLDNNLTIKEYFKEKTGSINCFDDYIDYLYLRFINNLEETIPNVIENARNEFTKIVEYFQDIFSKYNKSNLAKFIKENYKSILLGESVINSHIWYEIVDTTIEYLIEFCGNDVKVFEFIINNFDYKVFDNFDSFKKVFKKNKELYNILLSEQILKNAITYRIFSIGEVLKTLKNVDFSMYEEKLKIVVEIVKNKDFKPSKDNIMNTYVEIREFLKVLKELESTYFYEFEKEFNIQQIKMDEYLKENGNKYSFNVDIKPMIELLNDKNKKWYIKSLSITHSLDRKNNERLISNLEYIYRYGEKSVILDDINTGAGTDDTFKYSLITNLEISIFCAKQILNYMLENEERMNDLLSYIYEGVDEYFRNDNLYYDSKNFKLYMDMLYNALLNLSNSLKNKNEINKKLYIYNSEMLLCGILEKILRNMYYESTKNEKYVKKENATLGYLLRSEEIKNILGEFNCKSLEFYLLNYNGIGHNNRNIFAHFEDNIYEKLEYDIVLEELYLLLMVSNQLIVYRDSNN